MTALPGAELPGPRTPLYEHALRLHRLAPDRPLPRNGEPYPDHERHRGRPRPEASEGPRRPVGLDAARVLDAHFARGSARRRGPEAHGRAVGTLGPTAERFVTAASLAHYLGGRPLETAGCGARRQEAIRRAYASLLDREEWTATAHAALAAGDERMRWFADTRAPQMTLRAFPAGRPPGVSA